MAMTHLAKPTASTTSGLATFRLEVKYVRIAEAFSAAEIRTILLKGPAFDQLLFDGTRARVYSDIDLLVDPARIGAAEHLLGQLGFRRAEPESGVRHVLRRGVTSAADVLGAGHATAWIRDGDRFIIDLHDTLPQVRETPEQTWRALSDHRSEITVVDARVETLDRIASALLIALHAAHHGPR